MRQLQVLFTLHFRERNRIIRRLLLIKQAEQIACGKQSHTGLGDQGFVDHTVLHRIHDLLVSTAAVDVTAVLQRQLHGFLRCRGDFVIFMEIADCPAVGDKMSPEAPFCPQNVLQRRARAAYFAVGAVIGTHDGLDVCFFDAGLKSRQIGFFHILGIRFGVEGMAQRLRS